MGGSGCRRYGQRAFGLRYYVLEFHVLTALVDERFTPHLPSAASFDKLRMILRQAQDERRETCDPRGAVVTPAVLVKAMLLNKATYDGVLRGSLRWRTVQGGGMGLY